MNRTDEPSPQLEQRVAKHDAQFDAINERLASIERAQREILDRTKPNWSTYAAWSGVILSVVFAIGGTLGWGFQRDMGRVETILAKGIELCVEESYTNGRSTAIQERLRNDVDRFRDEMRSLHREQDEQLQREMRLLDSAMQAQINDFDKRLQNEMDLKLAPLKTDLEWMKREQP